MVLIFSKPTTPSQRHLIRLSYQQLLNKPVTKRNIFKIKSKFGKNHSGRITVRGKMRGQKKKYRRINFSRTDYSVGIVVGLEYDPNRNTNIATIFDLTKNFFFYMLAPSKINIGTIVESGPKAPLYTGNSLPLFNIPQGSFIHNLTPGKKAQITRAAGTFSTLKEKNKNYAKVRLSSKKEKLIPVETYATLGSLSNEFYFLTRLGKAGHSRWLGNRPKVRGVAMNPVDHPHGGGEGKKSGKNFSPWGKPNKKKQYSK